MNSLALCSKQNTSYCLLFYFTNTTTTFAPNIDLSHEQCQQPWIETTWLIIRNQWSWNSAVRTMATCHVRQTVPTDYNMYDQYFHFKPLQTNKQRNKRAFSSNLCYPPQQLPAPLQVAATTAECWRQQWRTLKFPWIQNHHHLPLYLILRLYRVQQWRKVVLKLFSIIF